MSSIYTLSKSSQANMRYDEKNKITWIDMQYVGTPVFTQNLLDSLINVQDSIQTKIKDGAMNFDYLVLNSSTYTDAFGLGGDLNYFLQCIEANDRKALKKYADTCVDALVRNQSPHYTSVALVDGECLGGGFETALSCNVIIAERGVKFGFPEIAFGMFPGMGSVSFLSRRVNPGLAKRLVSEPRLYSAEEMYDMGIVDVLAEPGQAQSALNDFIDQNTQRGSGMRGIQHVINHLYPVSRSELQASTDIWVDVAFELSTHNLRLMKRLIRGQKMRWIDADRVGESTLPREAIYASNA